MLLVTAAATARLRPLSSTERSPVASRSPTQTPSRPACSATPARPAMSGSGVPGTIDSGNEAPMLTGTSPTATSGVPLPVRDLRRVLAVLPGVRPAGNPLVHHQLPQMPGRAGQPGHPVDRVHHQVEPV